MSHAQSAGILLWARSEENGRTKRHHWDRGEECSGEDLRKWTQTWALLHSGVPCKKVPRQTMERKVKEKTSGINQSSSSMRGTTWLPLSPGLLSQPIYKITSDSQDAPLPGAEGEVPVRKKAAGAPRDKTENESAWLSSVLLLQGSTWTHSHNLIHPRLCVWQKYPLNNNNEIKWHLLLGFQ